MTEETIREIERQIYHVTHLKEGTGISYYIGCVHGMLDLALRLGLISEEESNKFWCRAKGGKFFSPVKDEMQLYS